MKSFLFALLILCLTPLNTWAYPFDVYSVVLQNRVPLAQWIVLGEGRTVNNALGLSVIGIYHGESYNFRSVSVIEHSPRIIDRVPIAIQERIRDKDVKYYTMLWGGHMDPPLDKPDNIVLHPVVERWRLPNDWRGEVDNDARGFSVNVSTGIFNWSSNVAVAPGSAIPRGAISPINVNYHDRVYFSPDNGRIGLPRDSHEIATFWLLALDPGSNKAIVVFNIVGGGELVAVGERLEFFNWQRILRQLNTLSVNNRSILEAAIAIVRYDFEQNYGREVAREPISLGGGILEELFFDALSRGNLVLAQDLLEQARDDRRLFNILKRRLDLAIDEQLAHEGLEEMLVIQRQREVAARHMEEAGPEAVAEEVGVLAHIREQRTRLENEIKELEGLVTSISQDLSKTPLARRERLRGNMTTSVGQKLARLDDIQLQIDAKKVALARLT